MNRVDLVKVRQKRREIQDLEKMIRKNDENIRKLSEMVVSDTVTGSRPDLTIGPIKITGKPDGTVGKLQKRNTWMRQRITELEAEVEAAEEYIESIPDPRARRIARLRCETDMSWNEIAREIGGDATEDSCRMVFQRIVARCE